MENTLKPLTKPKRKKYVLRFYPKSLLMAVIILVLSFIEYRYSVTYVDEVCTIIAFGTVLLSIPKFTRRDTITFMLIGLAYTIGLFGNLIYALHYTWFSVGVDILSQMKIPMAFFSVKYALSAKEKQATIEMLLPIAKIHVVVNSILAIVSQFVNLGMTGSVRYGLKSYKFLFRFTQQYATVTFIMIGVIICSRILTDKQRNRYLIFCIISGVATIKSFSLIFTAIFILFYFFFRKNTRLNIPIIIVLAIVTIFISTYQIQEYLLDKETPRRLFIDYAVVNANQHFPLGSGFATYGSSEAAKNYARLYYEYGFNRRWGMSPSTSQFLCDTYWPTLLGQFGWIGAAAYMYVYLRIFRNLSIATGSVNRRAYLYAFFGQYMVHAIGSAILQSSTGFLGFMMISLCTVIDEDKENKAGRLSIHIKT